MPTTSQTQRVGQIHAFTLALHDWRRFGASLRRHVARQIKEFGEIDPAQRRFRGRTWWNSGGSGGDGADAGGKVQAPGATVQGVAKLTRGVAGVVDKERRPVAGACELTSLLAAALGPSGGFAAFLVESGGAGVTQLCASARRSRLLLDVVDDCSCVGRKLSSRVRAIIRKLSETVFALNFLATGGVGLSESCDKVECSILCTNLVSPAPHRLHSVISDFRPASGTESGEASSSETARESCHWRLL